MRQLRAIVAAFFASLLLIAFAAPALADDGSGGAAAEGDTTTTTEADAPAEEEATEEEAPAEEEATEEEAPAEEEATEEEAPAEEATDAPAVTDDDDSGTSGGGDDDDDLDRPSANPGTGTTTGGQNVEIIIDSPAPGTVFAPGDTVVVKGRVAIGMLGASVDIVYTIDVSGSTGGLAGDCTGDGVDDTIMACQQAGALAINQQLTGLSGVQVGVASFDGFPYVNQGFTSPSDPAVTSAINALVPTGGTDFNAGLQATLDLFNTSSSGNRRISYFMSDGSGSLTQGPGTPLQAAIDAGIQVNTFSIGGGAANCTDPGSPLLIIAQSTGGVCTEVTDISQIVNVLGNLRPAGITKVEVSINGGPPVEASVDLLGNFEATVGNIVVGDNTIVATVFTEDGTQVSADVVVQGVEEGAPTALLATRAVHPQTASVGTLPVTGSDSLPLAGVAAMLLAVGGALVVLSRKAAQRA